MSLTFSDIPGMHRLVVLVLAALQAGVIRGDGGTNGFFKFINTNVIVAESTVFSEAIFKIQRTGGTAGEVLVTCEIVNSTAGNDIHGVSKLIRFGDGDTLQPCSFRIKDDNIAEGNETFFVRITKVSGGGEVGTPSEAELTILANDDAHGIVGFVEGGPVSVHEPQALDRQVSLKLERKVAAFGAIDVAWKISSGPDNGASDFRQTTGIVQFSDGQTEANLTLEVTPDDIAENAETFEIKLETVTGGAKLDQNAHTLSVIIQPNDAAVRFLVQQYAVLENETSLSVEVSRGLQIDGTEMGPVQEQATVVWSIRPGTAKPGQDYTDEENTLTFNPRETKKSITVTLKNDHLPEIAENFTIVLSNGSQNVFIVPPGLAVVTILPNDDHNGVLSFSQTPEMISEDGGDHVGTFFVNRSAGTFGDVQVSWEIRNGSVGGADLNSVFSQTAGVLSYAQGESLKSFNITVKSDLVPEEAQQYYVQLSGATGGARLSNTPSGHRAVFYVPDSDDVYGIVEFADEGEQHIQLKNRPRRLELKLNRTGGSVGDLSVEVKVLYFTPGSSAPSNELSLSYQSSVTIASGATSAPLVVSVSDASFIRADSLLKVELLGVNLTGGATPQVNRVPPKTPRIGARNTLSINITAEDANGEVGFAPAHQSRDVQEPMGGAPWPVVLTVMRSGTSQEATVFWNITSTSSSFLASDVGAMEGQVVFLSGQDRVNISVMIQPDDIPEVDEKFTVNLLNVTKPGRLQSAAETATVTIVQNDNPGGTFEFYNDSSVVLQEGVPFSFTIVRTGSALDARFLLFNITPSDEEGITGGADLVRFQPKQRNQTFFLIFTHDQVPELDEVFHLNLYGGGAADQMGVVGPKSSIQITVTQNDDPHGVLGFTAARVVRRIDESKNQKEIARFEVKRERGSFGNVTVFWNATGISGDFSNNDILPSEGMLEFAGGETSKFIEIESLPDNIPERNESFAIRLTDVTGGAKLSAFTEASLVISKNDDEVFFAPPTHVNVSEGSYANLTIRRGGDGTSHVIVTYAIEDGSASTSDGDYQIPASQEVSFEPGVFERGISIRIPDDSTPEGVEVFTVKLTNASGDTVLYGEKVATVWILASDGGTGVFQFEAASRNKSGSEGQQIEFRVERTFSTRGVVHLYWQLLRVLPNGSVAELAPGDEFNNVQGFVAFADNEASQVIAVEPKADGLAELDERFQLRLVRAKGIATGEDGKIGNSSEALLDVQANDDPRGVLLFDSNSKDVSIPEDFTPGMKNTTETNLTVLRDQGTWGRVQVCWEVFSASGSVSLPGTLFDLFLLGEARPGVQSSPGKRRPDTGTYVFCFDSSRSESYVQVPVIPDVKSDLSISAWVQPAPDSFGYVIASTSAGQINYALGLNTSDGRSHVKLAYLTNTTNFYVAGTNIADGEWHFFVVTVDEQSKEIKTYVDGDLSNTWNVPTVSLSDSGVVTVGGGVEFANFTGCIQDARIYPQVLTPGVITSMSKGIKKLAPINGYMTYDEGISKQDIRIGTVDNNLPEKEETFSLMLFSPRGGARVEDSGKESRLTVLKSDNANGLFEFASLDPVSVAESQNISVNVKRLMGTSGRVTVTWRVYGATPAVQDFLWDSGSIAFEEGEVEKALVVPLNDDTRPELAETFVLELVSAQSTEGAASTPTSGASLRPGHAHINVTIQESDFPYGLLQFMASEPVGNLTVPPATAPFKVEIAEEVRVLRLFVIRAQGTQGVVTCEWKMIAGSAVPPTDYVDNAGTLTYADGQTSATINIMITDDPTPELNKSFEVQLFSPVGAALSPVAWSAMVEILPSDDAFGVVNFTANSLMQTVTEGTGSSATFTVQRTGGTLGAVIVYWQASGKDLRDLIDTNGTVVIATGSRTAQFSIRIRADEIPELSESFIINLTAVSAGRLASRDTRANLTVLHSDDPHGVFAFEPATVRVIEQNASVWLSVVRRRGTTGTVRVNFTTSDHVGAGLAEPNKDYIPHRGSLVFSAGQQVANFTVVVLDDVLPEDEEEIVVNLTSAELLGGPAVAPAPSNSPRLGSDKAARIVIEKNDDANGVLQLSRSSVTVNEPNGAAIVNVTRTGGTFGEVTVYLGVTPDTANGSDYVILYSNVTFNPGQTLAAIPISIVDDQAPEFDESFRIRLLSAGIQGGASLGSPTECTVTIAENDYPYGLIGFDSASLTRSVQEPSSQPNRVALTVVRRFGVVGATKVHWEATLGGRPALNDSSPVRGDLVFATNDRSKTIEFDVLPDDIPEVREVIKFNLTVTEGRGVIDAATRIANVAIEANDAPHGVVEFSSQKYDAREGSEARLSVVRKFGTAGDIRVFFSTGNSSEARQASENTDYIKTVNGSITIQDGEASAQISVAVVDDSTPELNETFAVLLEGVELIGGGSGLQPQLGGVRSAVVTILQNDDAHGLFVIKARDGDNGTFGSRVTVQEPDSDVPVYFVLERQGGTEGEVEVTLEVTPVSADSQDFSGLNGLKCVFANGVNASKRDLNVIVRPDSVPERNEQFVVKLVDPTGGARVASGLGQNVTVIIEANDGVAGRVSFAAESRSVVVAEGDQLTLVVTRSLPAAGRVLVDWQIEGVNASADFQPHNGTVVFSDGDTRVNISTAVQDDLSPEAREVFVVRLIHVRTYDVAPAGHASLVSAKSTATVTVGGSDEPHGVVEFEVSSRDVTVSEDSNTTLAVARLFGKIGAIRIHYQASSGSLQSLAADQRLASPGSDFIGGNQSIVIPDGEGAGQIPVWILNDALPELEEVFLVNITGVELVNASGAGNTLPRLGSALVTQVKISANDGTRGVLQFDQAKVYVDESIGTFNLTVLRTQGTFGVVKVNYYVEMNDQATRSDFHIPDNPGGESTLEFADGEMTRNITVAITDDPTAEDDESFEVILKGNSVVGGVVLGSPSRVRVTIKASDNAHGAFSLSDVARRVFEPGSGADNEAEFGIVRTGASFGTVVVGWGVVNASASRDLSPVRGNVTFAAGVTQGSFKIRALLDNTPEQAETFVIGLSIVSGGGMLSVPSQAELTIAENDSPYGELEITSSKTQTGSTAVEEDVGTVEATVKRTKGNYGRITVDYQTVPVTATAASGDQAKFVGLQKLKTVGARSWHVFRAYGDLYVALASDNRTGPLPEGVGDTAVGGVYGSTLFRWQGVLVPVQGFSTDGAVQLDCTSINNQVYLAVANRGSAGRHETSSRVYSLDPSGQLTVVQNISTQGASTVKFFHPPSSADTYLVVANQINNAGETRLQSKVYKWQGGQFTEVQDSGIGLTRSASGLAVFNISGSSMVAMTFYRDAVTGNFTTKSPVYRWQGNKFTLVQELDTAGPVGVEHFLVNGEHHLAVANSEGPAQVFKWDGASFVRLQDLPTAGAVSVKPYHVNGQVFIAVVESGGRLSVYNLNSQSGQFQLYQNTTVEGAVGAEPVVAPDPVAGSIVFLAVAVGGRGYSPLLSPAMLSAQADFAPRRGQLTFEDGQTELKLDFTILQDDTPERDETFQVVIFNATNKATVGPQDRLTVKILSNDDAHGRIGFAADSQFRVQPEETRDVLVTYEVIREFGAVGRVVALWNVTGNVSSADVWPLSGQVVFEDGVTSANISLTVRKDAVPELDEVAVIRLLRLTEMGSPGDPNRGAVLNTARAVATLLIPANDEPHGVIRWARTLIIAQDTGPKNVTLPLTIDRYPGLLGAVVVSYETVTPQGLSNHDDQVAQPGVDFRSVKSEVVIPAGVNSTQISLDITHYNDTMAKKIFQVNLTAVILQGGSDLANSPRIEPAARLLEVVIAQPNQSLGELNFNVSGKLEIQEDQGSIQLGVTRTGSLLGQVGFRFVVIPVTSGPDAPADASDYSPRTGQVMFQAGEAYKQLEVNITDDQTAELGEAFMVQMSRPLGGVRIGQRQAVQVVIVANDDPFGLFGFNVTDQVINQVQEGGGLQLRVDRAGGSFGEVHVTWRITYAPNPQVQNPDRQLDPMNGTLTFEPGDRTKFVSLSAVDDGVPEGDQEFFCELSGVDSGAKLNALRRKATVVIRANDKASGVLSIDQATRNLVVGEPQGNYDGEFVVRFVRKIGTFGRASLDWLISRQTNGAQDPADTFNVTSGRVVFEDGVSSQSVAVLVTDDNKPEEFAVYRLQITGAQEAELDSDAAASQALINVVASDHPYGVLAFEPPLANNATEEAGTVNFTVRRSKGIMGRLTVNYTTSSPGATQGADYEVPASVLEFANLEETKIISVTIKPDDIPELAEVISVRLTGVALVGSPPKNYSSVDGLQLNMPPVIGANAEARVTILQNDNARGTIQFRETTAIARERDKKVDIVLEREGGAIGAVQVGFRFQNGSAFSGVDFMVPGPLTFADGQRSATLSIALVDDSLPEHREVFTVLMTSLSNGATLGTRTSVAVTIETSDDPNGLFGFVNSSFLSLPNPNITSTLVFGVSRHGGSQGENKVSWKLLRVSPACDSSCPLSEDFSGPTTGELTFADGDRSTKFISLRIEPYRVEEPEETFVLTLYAVAGNGSVDELQSNVTIAVQKFGVPNGVFGFKSTVPVSIDEPDTGRVHTQSFTVQRTKGFQGVVKVNWRVVSDSGADPSQDFTSTSGTLTFDPGNTEKNIALGVRGDDVPELSETFTVEIVSAEGGADLDNGARNVSFTIRANDDPHGLFKLKSGAQQITVDSLRWTRNLAFTIERAMGDFGEVRVEYQLTYSDWYPGSGKFNVTLQDKQRELTKTKPLSSSAFLSPGSSFSIVLTSVQYVGAGGSSVPPKLASSSTQESLPVPEAAANAVLRFADKSRKVQVSSGDTEVELMVVRHGLFGRPQVKWEAGFEQETFPGFRAGQMSPTNGYVIFTDDVSRNRTFRVKALPMTVPDSKTVYAVYLHSATVSNPGGVTANVTKGLAGTAVVEYSGVVVIAPGSQRLTVQEGGKVTCDVLRQFSSLGSVQVTYSTFGSSKSFSIAEGEFRKSFEVEVVNNDKPEKDRVFYINLTAVAGAHFPRLGPNVTAKVTVQDDDSPNGVLSFAKPALTVLENGTGGGGRVVELEVRRTGGTLGQVTVQVRSVGGGEEWAVVAPSLKTALANRRTEANATVARDYIRLDTTVTFQNADPILDGGQVSRVQLTILDDSDPEPDEHVFVELAGPTGGARLATQADGRQPWAMVTIKGNDLMGGEFGFIPGSDEATVDEDGSATVTLKVGRTKAMYGTIKVIWQVEESAMQSQVEEAEGRLTFGPGVDRADLVITLRRDETPEFGSSFHVVLVGVEGEEARVDPERRRATINVLASDFPNGTVGFAEDARYKTVDITATEVELEVVRRKGSSTHVTVYLRTQDLRDSSTMEPGVKTYRASSVQDYERIPSQALTFKPGETSKKFTVTLTPQKEKTGSYPRAFEVLLVNTTNGAVLTPSLNTSMVIISRDQETTKFLKLKALAIKTPLTDEEINSILADLRENIKNPLDDERVSLTTQIIQVILNDKKSRSAVDARKLQALTRQTLMEIYDELLHESRDDTRGKSSLATSFESFAFSLVYGLPCDNNNPEALHGKHAAVQAFRKPRNLLNGLKVNSGGSSDYFQYPSDLYASQTAGSESTCGDVHFIFYATSHWFDKEGQKPLINRTVLSSSPDTSVSLKSPIKYRIHTSQKRVTPKGAECVFWNFQDSKWSIDGCTKKYDKEDYVECWCDHFSVYAASGESDDRAGYQIYFFAALFVCLGAFALAVISYLACNLDNTFTAKLLIHLFFACMMALLMLVVAAYKSPDFVDEAVSCSVVAIFIHYFFLCQFSWMFVKAWNLWRILVLNDEHTDRKYVFFFIMGWGLPIVVIALYILIMASVFKWEFTQMYADVHQNGEMCFIPNAYAALATCLGPVLLILMGVAVVFTQAYQVTPQWRYYDDIYRGRYNIKEMRHVIILFVAITLVWLFAGLHLAFGNLWLLIVFSVLTILTGMYVFVFFFVLRNQVRGHCGQSYAVHGVPPPIQTHDDFLRDQPSSAEHSFNSLQRRKQRASPDPATEWEDTDLGATPRSNRKLLVDLDESGSLGGKVNEVYEPDDLDNNDFDDLIFALKTRGQYEPTQDQRDGDLPPDDSDEHFEMRRISIADTHL